MFLALLATAAVAVADKSPQLPNYAPPGLTRPSQADIARVYPPEALRQGLGARVVMGCVVGAQGALTDCRTLAEEPPGLGFGAAAIALAPKVRLNPAPGREGGVVRIPLRFAPRHPLR